MAGRAPRLHRRDRPGRFAPDARYAAIVCVGCVIKGETPHFDFVAAQAAAGIQRVGLDTGVPATFGVITALTEEQALARAGGDVGNRGEEAANAALEMAAFVHAHRHRKLTMRDDTKATLTADNGLRQRRALGRSQPD